MRLLLLALTIVAALVATSPALAQSDDERAIALQLGRKGIDLYNAGRFEDALDSFVAAEAKVHSPVFVVYVARCEHKRGRWLTALKNYDRVLAETIADDAPSTWRAAQAEARVERDLLASSIPTVAIDVGDAPPASVSLWLDGVMVDRAQTQKLLVNPGQHEIVGQWGRRRARATFTAVPQQEPLRVALSFPPERAPRGTIPPTAPLSPTTNSIPDAADSSPASGHRTVGYVLLGVGGVAAAAALATGIAALVHDNALSDECFEGRCPSAVEADVVLLEDLQRATLGLSIASAATLIAGWIVTGTAPQEDAVALWVDADGAGLMGTWRW